MEEAVTFDGPFGAISGVFHSVENTDEIAIVLHGFSSTKESGAKEVSRAIATTGIAALRIDLDNQGASELDFPSGATVPNYIEQIEATISYVKQLGFREISLVGTSYSGLVAFAVALSHPELKRLVLRAPVVDYEEHANWEFGEEQLKKYKEEGSIPYYDKHNQRLDVTFACIEEAYPYSMYKHAHKVQTPTLIIQGDQDREVDYLSAKKVIPLFPDGRLYLIKGAGHNLGVNGDFSESLDILTAFLRNGD